MLTRDVPQWVQQSFIRSVRSIGATAGDDDITACYNTLVAMWCDSNRYHHDIRHLLDMLKRIDTLASETTNADLVRIAAWFHGVVFSTSDLDVYTRNGGENELASAKFAREELGKLGVEDTTQTAVANLIVGLKKPPKIDVEPQIGAAKPEETATFELIDMDQIVLRDAHLGSLATEPQKYKHYLADIEQEYAHIPQAHFFLARAQIVGKLLARKRLYQSPLAAQWEDAARENLEAELERLKAKLAMLDGASATAPTAETATSASSAESADIAGDDHSLENFLFSGSDAAIADHNENIPDLPAEFEDELAILDIPVSHIQQTSSMEKLDDIYSPGPAPRLNLTPEEAEREARKKTAEEARQAIETKRKEAHNKEL